MTYDLTTFGLADMIRCSTTLREIGIGASSFEDAAGRVVGFFRRSFIDAESGRSQIALARLYKTHLCKELEPDLVSFAEDVLGEPLDMATRCLTLVATAGEVEAWNSRSLSEGHRAIPLPSPQIVDRFPMISQLVKQFGLEIGEVIGADPLLFMDLDQRNYNVFHIERAAGSAHVPAQGFVRAHEIESVVGFGGMLPTGDLFAVILFSNVPITSETADLFKVLALSVKLPLLPFVHGPVFEPVSGADRQPDARSRSDD